MIKKKIRSQLKKDWIAILTLVVTVIGILIAGNIANSANSLAVEANDQSSKNLPIKYTVGFPQDIAFTADINDLNKPIVGDVEVSLEQGYIKDLVLIENDMQGISLRTLDVVVDQRENRTFPVDSCKMFSTLISEDKYCYNYCFLYITGGDGAKYLDCVYTKINLENSTRKIEKFQKLRKIDLIDNSDSQDKPMQQMKDNYKEAMIKISELPAELLEN